MTAHELAGRIEHTLLGVEATAEQVDALCDQALEYGFVGVCVDPRFVLRALRRLSSSTWARGDSVSGTKRDPHGPRIVSVAGFPSGSETSDAKADEAKRALEDGADEIDMVANLSALTAGEGRVVRNDIAKVATAVHSGGTTKVLKVILETAAMTTEQIILGCRCAMEGEADYVKTSTGHHPAGGATIEHVRLLHRYASPLKVKAAGGIRTAKTAMAMLEAGADRIGTSAGPAIVRQLS